MSDNIPTPIQTIDGSDDAPTTVGAISFDDMEALLSSKPHSRKEQSNGKSEEKSSETQTQEEVTTKSADDKATKAKTGNKAKNPPEDDASADLLEEAKEVAKILKYKAGDKEAEIPETAIFRKLIDGKEVEVTLKDLQEHYAGKVAWEKRFSELGGDKAKFLKERDHFTKEKTAIEQKIGTFLELAKGEDKLAAANYLLELNGVNPVDYMKTLRAQLLPIVEEWSKLTPEQRDLREKEEELGLLRRREDQRLSETQQQTKNLETHNKIQKLLDDNSIDQDTFVNRYKELVPLMKQQGLDTDKLQPEDVIDYHKELEIEGAMQNLVKEVNEELGGDNFFKAVDTMKDVYRKFPGYSVEDLKDIASQVFGSDKVKTLQKKVAKSKPQATPVQKVINPQHDPLDWDNV